MPSKHTNRPDPFAYRNDEQYRRNELQRNSGRLAAEQKQYWKFNMSYQANMSTQDNIRKNLIDTIHVILNGAEKVDTAQPNPKAVQYYTDRIMSVIEGAAGPVDVITNNEQMWEKMVISALGTARDNIRTDNDNNVIPGLTRIVRECVCDLEMNNLGLDQESYREHIRVQAAMTSHPGFVAGNTVAITPTVVRVGVIHPQDETTSTSPQASIIQPELNQTETTMNTTTTNTPVNETAEQAAATNAGQINTNTIAAKASAVKARATKLVIDMVPESDRAKKALKITAAAAVTAAVGYAGYRAYKAGYLDAAKTMLARVLPSTAQVAAQVTDEAQSMTGTVASFFK